jgi:2-dehydropantoate 2-reductase
MAPEPLRIAVLGPGGVGGLLGALLARAGNSVVMLAGEATAQAIAERGLRLESLRFGAFKVKVGTADRLASEVDVCVIAVKATQLDQALQRVPGDVLGQGLMVPFLNGIDHVAKLRALYPSSNVVPASIRVETERVEAGLIRQASPFALVEIATSDAVRQRVDLLAAQLRAAGLDVQLREDETAMLWDKLAVLAPLALLTTHERAAAGTIRTKRREDALALIAEVAAVARTQGAASDPEAAVRMLDLAPETFQSSMQRDQDAGRPLELDAIGGAVLRAAAQAGIDVPVTTRLVEELRLRGK